MKSLKSKKNFDSSLTNRKITYKEKKHVFNVWKKFEIKRIKDCYDLYCDVMLLADVLEKFENNSLKNYGLCPSHHLSAPGLSWDAMLNMTK